MFDATLLLSPSLVTHLPRNTKILLSVPVGIPRELRQISYHIKLKHPLQLAASVAVSTRPRRSPLSSSIVLPPTSGPFPIGLSKKTEDHLQVLAAARTPEL